MLLLLCLYFFYQKIFVMTLPISVCEHYFVAHHVRIFESIFSVVYSDMSVYFFMLFLFNLGTNANMYYRDMTYLTLSLFTPWQSIEAINDSSLPDTVLGLHFQLFLCTVCLCHLCVYFPAPMILCHCRYIAK